MEQLNIYTGPLYCDKVHTSPPTHAKVINLDTAARSWAFQPYKKNAGRSCDLPASFAVRDEREVIS